MAEAVASSPAAEGGGQEPVVDETTGAAPKAGGGQQGGSESEGAPGEVAPEKPKARQRKEKLPGVVSRDDGDDIFPELGFKSSKKPGRVNRDQAMRELEAEMRQEGKSIFDPADIPELPEGEKPPEEKPAPKKLKFADKEYDSVEAIEQSFKSLQGMFKPMQDRMSEAERVAQQAADSARAWRERAIALESGQIQPQPSTPRPLTPPTVPTNDDRAQLEAALKNIDGDLFESIAREHGLPLAGRYLAGQVLSTVHDQLLPALRKEIMDQIMPDLEPMKQDRGFQQATKHVAGLIEQVGQYKNQDGSDAFPELSDPDTVYKIADLWRSMDLPVEVALTQKGLLQAVALYRMYNPQSATPTARTVQEVSRPAQTAPSAASQSLEAGQAPSPVRVRSDEGTRFARELENAPIVDKLLGFSIRRRN